MKSRLLLFLCLPAILGLALSCNKDDQSKGYIFSASIHIVQPQENFEQQEQALREILETVGLKVNEFSLTLFGSDSTEVSGLLKKKMEQVNSAVEASSVKIEGDLEIKGMEVKHFGTENDHTYSIGSWYSQSYGGAFSIFDNDPYLEPLCPEDWFGTNENTYHWVKSLRTASSNISGDSYKSIDLDMNRRAGGNDIYLVFDYIGSRKDDSVDAIYGANGREDELITDVIAVCSNQNNPPSSLTIGGRYYTRATGVCDLNAGCGPSSPWIWLYISHTRTLSIEEYLITGGEYNHGCFALYDNGWFSHTNFNASDYLPEIFHSFGRFFKFRVVQMYDIYGNHLGEADFNKGIDSNFIKLVLVYTQYKYL